MKIAIGSDHGGYKLKTSLVDTLKGKGITVIDMGTDSAEAVDYPDYGAAVSDAVSNAAVDQGIIICTSGVGMSITANKFPRVRAALCMNADMAAMSRQHNNANILCMGAMHTPPELARELVIVFLANTFEGGRHERRVCKFTDWESEPCD